MPREYAPPSPATLRWVARQVHPQARVTSVRRLLGGLTADMDRLTVDSAAGVLDVVLRRWPTEDGEDGQDGEDGLVAQEAAGLAAIRGTGVPAPALLATDEDGSATGVRCTLTSALPGEPDLAPADLPSWLGQLATTQAAIHAVPLVSGQTAYDGLPVTSADRYADRPRPLDWLADRGLRDAARAAAEGPVSHGPRSEERALVHGDYQPYNVLWVAGRLSGVVDWPHAAIGRRGSDVGHCRLNLAVLFDAEATESYLQRYERAAGVRVDRRADLRALLCFDLEWERFIPVQVAGRAEIDVAGMRHRVAAVVRQTLDGLG